MSTSDKYLNTVNTLIDSQAPQMKLNKKKTKKERFIKNHELLEIFRIRLVGRTDS